MWHYVAFMLVGLAAGFSSALLGIGGGVIMVPMLILLFALDAKAATATSLVYIVPVALYGALKQWHMGQDIRWLLVAVALPAGLLGAELGSRAKQVISNAHLQIVFAALMIVIGLRLGLQGYRALGGAREAGGGGTAVQAPAEPPGDVDL